jgi:hypothetical protein
MFLVRRKSLIHTIAIADTFCSCDPIKTTRKLSLYSEKKGASYIVMTTIIFPEFEKNLLAIPSHVTCTYNKLVTLIRADHVLTSVHSSALRHAVILNGQAYLQHR